MVQTVIILHWGIVSSFHKADIAEVKNASRDLQHWHLLLLRHTHHWHGFLKCTEKTQFDKLSTIVKFNYH